MSITVRNEHKPKKYGHYNQSHIVSDVSYRHLGSMCPSILTVILKGFQSVASMSQRPSVTMAMYVQHRAYYKKFSLTLCIDTIKEPNKIRTKLFPNQRPNQNRLNGQSWQTYQLCKLSTKLASLPTLQA